MKLIPGVQLEETADPERGVELIAGRAVVGVRLHAGSRGRLQARRFTGSPTIRKWLPFVKMLVPCRWAQTLM